jgi:muconolactone delta-isomerase
LLERFSELLLQAASSSHHRIHLLLREWIYVQHWQMWGQWRCLSAFEQKNQQVVELEVWKAHQPMFEWQMMSWASLQTRLPLCLAASERCHALGEHSPS